MIKKLFIVIAVYLGICLIYLYSCYIGLIDMYQRGFIDKVMFCENLMGSDYHSIKSYGLVIAFAAIVSCYFFLGREQVIREVRYASVFRYCFRLFIQSICFFLLLSFLYEGCCVILSLCMGDVELLIKHHWVIAVIFQGLVAALFYTMMYFLFLIVSLYVKKGFALFLLVIFLPVQLYFGDIIWMPSTELDWMQRFAYDEYTALEPAVVLLRYVLVMIIIFFVFKRVKERKDNFSV